ncbi:MAG: biotin/lipoyl-binding protein [Prevotella sp.]|nr:biotin/lipoyl-binding protein [Prevotella sp.]
MKEYKYKIDGKEYVVAIGEIADNVAQVTVNGEAFSVEMEAEQEPEKKKVVLGQPESTEKTEEAAAQTNVATDKAVKAPLPGVITSIEVEVGQQVKAGDTIVVLEAMKMANNIEAENDGTVVAICVKTGENVLEDAPLVVIE